MTPNKWYHLAIAFDGTRSTLYVGDEVIRRSGKTFAVWVKAGRDGTFRVEIK